MKPQRAWQPALILSLLCAVTVACGHKPVVPSGANRVPINNEHMINQYHERVKSEQRDKHERTVLTRQVEALMKQVEDLSATVTLVQLQHQDTVKGTSRQGQKHGVTAASTSSAPLPEGTAVPVDSAQTRSASDATKSDQGDEGRATSVGTPACAVRPSTETAHSSLGGDEPHRDSWVPRVIKLGKREQVELHRHSIIFRVSQRTGRSEFVPSKRLQSYLKHATQLGHCLEVRGYTDGDKDRWVERETATQRAQKARAYLIAQRYAPKNILVTIVPIGDHVADNATKQGRAKNRRVEIEVRGNPASVLPEWYG